jgi:hypothetical protein
LFYNWFAGRQQLSQNKILIVQEFLEDQRKGPPPEQVERIRKTEIRCTKSSSNLQISIFL